MPKLCNEEDQIIDLSNINPNKMVALSFNYELLKYIIRGRRIPTTDMARGLTVFIDFSFLTQRIFRINAIIDGIIPTNAKDVSNPNMEIISANTVICMKFILIFCAYFTKIVSI